MKSNLVAKDFHHNIRTSIQHQVLFLEIIRRLDNSKHLGQWMDGWEERDIQNHHGKETK